MNAIQAHALIEEMRIKIQHVNLTYYINPQILQLVYSSLNLPMPIMNQLIENEEVTQSRPQTAVGVVEDAYESEEEEHADIQDDDYQQSNQRRLSQFDMFL
ncbi:hypothetical protein GQR58_016606 [Nymphon striatum]|nr:hypothetical protein GQR58_016606 [Nymphon striatum]